ncbi:MAG: hypothetical protein JSS76_08415 [Bacteroidetes bacterium]|nr:hypothetical protein [Bacteroidota bacterium]
MFTIADIESYFENVAHQLRYVGHTMNVTNGKGNHFTRFTDEEISEGTINGLEFPRLSLSKLPDGNVAPVGILMLDRLAIAVEVATKISKKGSTDEKMTAWNDSRNAVLQIVARIKENKDEGSCVELEKYLDLKTVSYGLFENVVGADIVCGTRLLITIQSYAPKYDAAQWQP